MPKQPKYYQSIDEMPVYNWFKINETNDTRWMLLDKNKEPDNKATEAFQKVLDEYIDTFGISENYLRRLELKKELICHMTDLEITKDRFIENFIDQINTELSQLDKKEETRNTNSGKVHLEKYMGFRINTKETTVKEYYEYMGEMNAEIQQRNVRQIRGQRRI